MKATKQQVRAFYESQGYVVSIDDIASGHVLFRKPDEKLWREGRWVSEYRVEADGTVRLT